MSIVPVQPESTTPEAVTTPESALDLSGLEPMPEPSGNPVLDRFWVSIKRLPKYLKLAANLARDSRVPRSSKAALLIGGAYTISPIDLVPGVIPVAGQLDDLAVLLFSIRTAIRACPPEVAAEHLERAGISANDFDDDLASVRETVQWLATSAYRVTRKYSLKGGQRLQSLWRTHIRPS